MYDLIRILRPSLIRRSVNLVSAVRIEGSNFNQWLSVIEIQTNFCFIFGRCKAWYERVQQHQVVTLRQVVILWFEHLEYLKKTIRRHVASGEALRGFYPPIRIFKILDLFSNVYLYSFWVKIV